MVDTGPLLLTGMACVTMVVLWSVGALLFATFSGSSSSSSSSTSSLLRLQDGSAFPSEFWDVWPDSSNVLDGMEGMLESCYPADDPKKCRIVTSSGNNHHHNKKRRRIAIIRLPGQLGMLMETFLQDLLATWMDATTTTDTTTTTTSTTEFGSVAAITNEALGIQLVPTSDASIVNLYEHQQHLDDYEKDEEDEEEVELPIAQIIRPVVLPPLLEALDLILQTQNANELTLINMPTIEELQAVLQQVMRWHCQVAHQTEHRARMTILLDETIVYSNVIGEDIGNFLNLSFDKDKNAVDSINDLSVQLIQRLGQAWHLARDIWESSNNSPHTTIQLSKEEWVQHIMQNELLLQQQKDQTSCLSPLDVYPKTRVTELVGTFLSGTSTSAVCHSYPQSILCQERSRQSS